MKVGELPRLDRGGGFRVREIFSPSIGRRKGGREEDGEVDSDGFWRMFGRGGNARKGMWGRRFGEERNKEGK